MKLNKKGFLLLETLIVAVFSVTTFTFLFQSAIPLAGLYEQRSIENGNVNIVYSLYHIRKFLKTDNLYKNLSSNYNRITCNDFENKDYCNSLTEALGLSFKKGETYQYTFDLYYIKGFNEFKTAFIGTDSLELDDAVKTYVKNYETTLNNVLVLYDRDNDAVSIIGLDTETFSCYKYKKVTDPDSGKFYLTIYDRDLKEYKYYHVLTGDSDGEALNKCVSYFKNQVNPLKPGTDEVYDDETISKFCKLDTSTRIVENKNFIEKYLYNDYDPLFFKQAVHMGFMENISELQIPESLTNYMVIGYDSSCSRNAKLEEQYNGKKVIMVGFGAFKNKNMKSVTLTKNIKVIDKEAFWGMKEENIKLKNSPIIIGNLIGE